MPTPVTAAGAPRSSRRTETPLEAWHRLHDEVPREPVTVRSRPSSPGTASTRQDREVTDFLEGVARAHPFWPDLEKMGVTGPQAYAAVNSLKRFDGTGRRSSLSAQGAGTEPLRQALTKATAMARVVDGLVAGQPLAGLLRSVDAVEAKVLTGAARRGPADTLAQALTLLEHHVGAAITDTPADLLELPKETQAALESALRGRTHWLGTATTDASDRGLYARTGDYAVAFGHLRELAVLEPTRARTLGRAFVAALQAASVGTTSDFNPQPAPKPRGAERQGWTPR